MYIVHIMCIIMSRPKIKKLHSNRSTLMVRNFVKENGAFTAVEPHSLILF